MIPKLVLLLCIVFGKHCVYAQGHITHYAPQLGGVNCQKPCDQDGLGRPIQYGIHAACDLRVYNSRVYVEDVGWRKCWDAGGEIHDFDVDIAVPASECEWISYEWKGKERLWCAHWVSGERNAVWIATEPMEGYETMRKQWDRFHLWAQWVRKQPQYYATSWKVGGKSVDE